MTLKHMQHLSNDERQVLTLRAYMDLLQQMHNA
jgi:hypothetical protein